MEWNEMEQITTNQIRKEKIKKDTKNLKTSAVKIDENTYSCFSELYAMM